MQKRNKQLRLTAKDETREIDEIEKRLKEHMPAPGTNPLAVESPAPGAYAGVKKFDDLPLSRYSREGLKHHKFKSMTAIQRATLPHTLCGRDLLGAAKTGSGKTLAFLLPVLEKLFRLRWSSVDGLGALIITPTRELAMQIFQEARKVGMHHTISAGLLIGGKDVKEESARIAKLNLLVATPGRLLQHMDETPNFDCGKLEILVMDEADRILDMGFRETMEAILEHLPRHRQTLLFSATQTRSVGDLARLSLRNPEFISVHAEAQTATPLRLQQVYAVVKPEEKMDVLWSFLKSHLKSKCIVFLSTCKQVRFVFEAFRRLRPGIPLRALHGKMKQQKRMVCYYEFCEAKSMCLLATDIAARGLDFPAVDWVVQLDCPEDVATYIHRVGRTARYTSGGKSLAFLTEKEAGALVPRLDERKIPAKKIRLNPEKRQHVGPALAALLSKVAELKAFAQGALSAYLKSIFLAPDKDMFDVSTVDSSELALSMGLASVPRLRFLPRGTSLPSKATASDKAKGRSPPGSDSEGPSGSESGPDDDGEEGHAQEGARGRDGGPSPAPERKMAVPVGGGAEGSGREEGGGAGAGDPFGMAGEESGSDDEEELLAVKSRIRYDDEGEAVVSVPGAVGEAEGGKKKKKKKKTRIDPNKLGLSNRVVFTDDGEAKTGLDLLGGSGEGEGKGEADEEALERIVERAGLDVGEFESAEERFRRAREILKERDARDRQAQRERLKEKRLKKKMKEKLEKEQEGVEVVLGGESDEVSGSGRYGGPSDSADETGGGVRRGRASSGSPEGSSDSDGSDSDDGLPRGFEVACAGMRQKAVPGKPPAGEGGEDGPGGGRKRGREGEDGLGGKQGAGSGLATGQSSASGKKRKLGKKSVEDMSLAEQEALALKLIGA